MKKCLIFLLLVLLSMGTSAETISLSFGSRTGDTEGWGQQNVTDAKTKLQKGDFVIVSYTKVTSDNCQYAICNEGGTKIYTNGADVVNGATQDYYTCPVGDRDFGFTIDDNLLAAIQSGGLAIQDKGLNTDGKMTIKVMRMDDAGWDQYKPTNAIDIMATPQYIKDWYEEGYVLKTSQDYIGKTLRVVCLDTADDSYAFLKEKGDGDPAIMSGSDKFSIAGWKFFEIKINSKLNALMRDSNKGLRIGGNNYFIAGIYVYGSDTTAPDWVDEESDVIDTYTFSAPLDGTSEKWGGAEIPGKFFEFKGQGDQISTTKLANTKNNIVRLVFDGTAGDGAQVSAKDVDGNKNAAAYIRQRKLEKVNGVDSYYYVNYADCAGVDHYDFELSDAITVFDVVNDPTNGYRNPITNSAEGVKKGMLSTLLLHGMEIGVNNVKITAVQLRKSLASKYISGYAVYTKSLSNTQWQPISLPYNLTQEQVKETFGENALVCELGPSSVTKKYVGEDGVAYSYGISLNFVDITQGINANYPYIIKMKKGTTITTDSYIIQHVKADVRDFQAYEFRTPPFTFHKDFLTEEPKAGDTGYSQNIKIWNFEQEIKNEVSDAYMIFQSTAPVFDITNTNVGDVEIINDVNQITTLVPPANQETEPTCYFFYQGGLYPVLTKQRPLKSGSAYIKFPYQTYKLFNDDTNHPAEVSLAKLGCNFPDDKEVTGIEEVVLSSAKQQMTGIYTLGGQLVRLGESVDGLVKGIYIVNGKKVIVK